MKTKSTLYVLLFMLISCAINAQIDRNYNFLLALNSGGNDVGQTHYTIGQYLVKGNPYLYKSSIKVEFFQNGNSYRSENATFDTYFQLLEHNDISTKNIIGFDITNMDSFFVRSNSTNDGANFNGAKFINASLFDSTANFFLEEIAISSKLVFYAKHTSTLVGYGSGLHAATGNNPYKEFKQEKVYYWKEPNGNKFKKITLKEKNIKKILEKHYSVVGFMPNDNLEASLKEFLRDK